MKSVFMKLFLVLLVFLIGGGAGFMYRQKTVSSVLSEIKDPYLSFLSEVYDTIRDNYWEKISEESLVELFQLGTENLVGQPQSLKKRDRENLEKMEKEILAKLKEPEKQNEYAAKLADIVLSNLKPLGRSRLYTRKEEKALAENVRNINPETKQVETTVNSRPVSPGVFYLRLKKISPTSLADLKETAEKTGNVLPTTDAMILDLRDNVGGSIDHLPFLLGPFIGNDQYAFQTFHRGEKTDFKTRAGWLPGLVKYKKVVILINSGTQSSAEVMAAVLKKYNVGVVVGKPTKGWGTIERVFELTNQQNQTNKYSIFLAHSLALREDGQPIEGKGVEPAINIDSPNWQAQLLAYFNYPELARAVKEVWEEGNF